MINNTTDTAENLEQLRLDAELLYNAAQLMQARHNASSVQVFAEYQRIGAEIEKIRLGEKLQFDYNNIIEALMDIDAEYDSQTVLRTNLKKFQRAKSDLERFTRTGKID